MRVFLSLSLMALLTACSSAPTETVVKEPEKPPAPITARQAFQYTYPAARMWAADSEPLRVRSINLPDVPPEPGKAAAWEITYVSAMQQGARIYTWSAVEAPGPVHKGLFAGKPQSWGGASGQERPFSAAAFHIDTPAALEAAIAQSKSYLDKPGQKPAINFLLEYTPRFPDAVWRVMWGETAGSAEYTIFVDAGTGQVVGKS
ncbi:MAG TPA: hypothetical protein VGJ09_04140 [Bryobacteraceae bacterium]|jgi:hypothetical protein